MNALREVWTIFLWKVQKVGPASAIPVGRISARYGSYCLVFPLEEKVAVFKSNVELYVDRIDTEGWFVVKTVPEDVSFILLINRKGEVACFPAHPLSQKGMEKLLPFLRKKEGYEQFRFDDKTNIVLRFPVDPDTFTIGNLKATCGGDIFFLKDEEREDAIPLVQIDGTFYVLRDAGPLLYLRGNPLLFLKGGGKIERIYPEVFNGRLFIQAKRENFVNVDLYWLKRETTLFEGNAPEEMRFFLCNVDISPRKIGEVVDLYIQKFPKTTFLYYAFEDPEGNLYVTRKDISIRHTLPKRELRITGRVARTVYIIHYMDRKRSKDEWEDFCTLVEFHSPDDLLKKETSSEIARLEIVRSSRQTGRVQEVIRKIERAIRNPKIEKPRKFGFVKV